MLLASKVTVEHVYSLVARSSDISRSGLDRALEVTSFHAPMYRKDLDVMPQNHLLNRRERVNDWSPKMSDASADDASRKEKSVTLGRS